MTISPDGLRVLFLRSVSGVDPRTCLWELDVLTGEERLVLDPASLAAADGELPAEERARRERARESATGIVTYSADDALVRVAVALAGGLWVVDLATGDTRPCETPGAVVDPRLSPGGRHVAYVTEGELRLVDLESGEDRPLASPDGPDVSWGLAEFIAAEEMDREHGTWWSPDGTRLLAQRTDETGVLRWHIGDPADPAAEPSVVAYPAAGTRNASVTLWLIDLDGARLQVPFDDEYLAEVTWDRHALHITTLSRDQHDLRVWQVDPASGGTRLAWSGSDGAWMDVRPGLPRHLPDGSMLWLGAMDGWTRLLVDGRPVTPPGLEVRDVLSVDGGTVLMRASVDPVDIGVWAWSADTDPVRVSPEGPGVWGGRGRGGTLVLGGQSLSEPATAVRVRRVDGPERVLGSVAEDPGVVPVIHWLEVGERRLRTAVLLPRGHVPGSRRLPVLLDPYGGPGHQRVLAAPSAFLTSQWFADQGFVVVVADGRGTPGRGPAFERAVAGDLASHALEDQVAALGGVVAAFAGDTDRERVAIRGWSFGGYLAALAVLRRPDVVHAAIAGAPVTDWRLYDTCYTERYLGHPDTHPVAYERSSLLDDASALRRPLMIIHGLADDNVVSAHTLRLSTALLEAGRPHRVLPLTGVTHMTNREQVAENLLLLQVDFLREALGT